MREFVRNIFTSLPSEGIGIHGTNKSRARAISEEGLHSSQGVFFLRQLPELNDPIKSIRAARWKIFEAALYAEWAAHDKNHVFTNDSMDRIASLVLFFSPSIQDLTLNPSEPIQHTYAPIPKDNVIDVITLGSTIPNFTAEYTWYWNGKLRDILHILREKKIICFGEFRQPPPNHTP